MQKFLSYGNGSDELSPHAKVLILPENVIKNGCISEGIVIKSWERSFKVTTAHTVLFSPGLHVPRASNNKRLVAPSPPCTAVRAWDNKAAAGWIWRERRAKEPPANLC